MYKSLLCVVTFLTTLVAGTTQRFDNQTILSLTFPTSESTNLMDFLTMKLALDVWNDSPEPVDERSARVWVRVDTKEHMETVKALDGVSVDVVTDNLQEWIDRENEWMQEARLNADWFEAYHRFDEIVGYYSALCIAYPDLMTFIPSIGKTHEGRDIFAVKITSKKNGGGKKQFWFHGLQHAREWIGGAVVQYISTQLVKGYGSDNHATSLLDAAEFIIVPVMNPDGYEYSHVSNRMWRKNRRVNKANSYGVDLNRNWPDHWASTGSSNYPSSETYHGPSAGSEPEVTALRNYFLTHTNIVGAIDFHCFSQLVLRPYGWSKKAPPKKVEERLVAVGQGIVDAISGTHGRSMRIFGVSSCILPVVVLGIGSSLMK